MLLALTLANQFSVGSRERGFIYFRQKRVRVSYGNRMELGAKVQGSELYEVILRWTGTELAVLCDCVYFIENAKPCKHLWAAVLAADAGQYLAEAAAVPAPKLDVDDLLYQIHGPDLADLSTPPKFGRTPTSGFKQPPAAWKKQLSSIFQEPGTTGYAGGTAWPASAVILYIINIAKSQTAKALTLSVETREPKKNGGWKVARPLNLKMPQMPSLPLAEDREILSLLMGGRQNAYSYGAYDQVSIVYQLSTLLAKSIFSRIVRTGRCFVSHEKSEADLIPLTWDEGDPWQFVLQILESPDRGGLLCGEFRRGTERMNLVLPLLVIPGGYIVTSQSVFPLAEDAAFPWIASLSKESPIVIPAIDREEFLSSLLGAPVVPTLDLPANWELERVDLTPRPCLKIYKHSPRYASELLRADLSFDYGGRSVPEGTIQHGFYEPSTRRFIRRDLEAERVATALLREQGLRFYAASWSSEAFWEMTPAKLPRTVRALAELGWHITAEGKAFRHAGFARAEVTSGLDWFELHGEVEFGETKAQLPQLLQALKRGETMITLDDGSFGLLPEEWLSRFGAVASMGAAQGDHIRFGSSQAGLLDALLATQPEINGDEAFRRVRQELDRFQQISPAPQPAGFVGQLRDYQREGLGWMHFLRQFSFGGCLADDMGVGKTAQVLALLETRRELRAKGEVTNPSLAVLPKSLLFNWKQEAARFTPQLRLLDHTGTGRDPNKFADVDLVLTTYGTLRRDAVRFKDTVFDYVILDEAQAIKNSNTESAKAVRLLLANHFLALSGTPVENHLGELWSLFEVLNPGLLGASSVFQLTGGALRNPSEETRKLLAHALRPFILRRTKEQVAKELPTKVEQTIYCEMESRQRTLYNDLRQHYRDLLLNKISSDGIAKSRIQVLEALLRLRQAACHPGLIDPKLVADPSAKLDVLLERLREVLDEGHKVLVFSQFTSLLAIVRRHLKTKGTVHEYLDGKTTDRQACVERFQNDPDCRLFLISLKAGGLGLNLTAADYVFILDPWWNPAVEAQAVDRAHRIGQARKVFAYRLIARDTVEEKVLQLQETKRHLADAILGASNSLIRELRVEDIELLLS